METLRVESALSGFLVFIFVGVALTQTWVEMQVLTASDKSNGDLFGYSASLTENYALVGAYEANLGGPYETGAAYVFVRCGTIWTHQAILTASNKAANDRFGWSVSLTDNYALVGAYLANSHAGAAYVYARSGTIWTQQAILVASRRTGGDWFGVSVSLTDNYALIGAYYADSVEVRDSGAAYVFLRSGTIWTQQAILTASNKAAYDRFGFYVSFTENHALVGAPYSDPSSLSNAGSAYYFIRSGASWSEESIITASNKSIDDRFGHSVSLTENYALIGAIYADPGSVSNSGAAYVFVRNHTLWSEKAILTASNKGENKLFGLSVLMQNNLAMVGVVNPRMTYVFTFVDMTWTESSILSGMTKVVSQTERYFITADHMETVEGLVNAGQARIFFNPGMQNCARVSRD